MLPITCLTRSFEGKPLPFFTLDGKLATLARHLGARLGYARSGERLVTNVMGDWASEFIEGKHWVRLAGEDLAAFQKAYGRPTASVGGSASSLIVLLEPGIHLVLLKTNKPAGVRLRDFLATEVLPQLLRTGQFTPPTDDSEGKEEPPSIPDITVVVALPPVIPSGSIAADRERRLARQHELRRRKTEAEWLRDTARAAYALAQIDALTLHAFEVRAAEIILGKPLAELRPAYEEPWYTFEQVRELTGLGFAEMTTLLKQRSLLYGPGLTREALTLGKDGQIVATCLYNDRAVSRMIRMLSGQSNVAGA